VLKELSDLRGNPRLAERSGKHLQSVCAENEIIVTTKSKEKHKTPYKKQQWNR
jgi:hypothetical protein